MTFKQATLTMLIRFSVPTTQMGGKKQPLNPCQLLLWLRSESQKNARDGAKLAKKTGVDESKRGKQVVNENIEQYL